MSNALEGKMTQPITMYNKENHKLTKKETMLFYWTWVMRYVFEIIENDIISKL